MSRMIEHMFGSDKFGAEFPSAAQDSISQNSLRNVQLTISRTDTSRFSSVPSRTAGSGGRSLGGAMASDHYGVVADLEVRPGS